jgi:hypothetical protein
LVAEFLAELLDGVADPELAAVQGRHLKDGVSHEVEFQSFNMALQPHRNGDE